MPSIPTHSEKPQIFGQGPHQPLRISKFPLCAWDYVLSWLVLLSKLSDHSPCTTQPLMGNLSSSLRKVKNLRQELTENITCGKKTNFCRNSLFGHISIKRAAKKGNFCLIFLKSLWKDKCCNIWFPITSSISGKVLVLLLLPK